MIYTASHIVRTYECDSYGHVNNAVYLNLLEFARMEFLHAIDFDYKGLIAAGYYLYVTHIDIYYKASAFLDDELFIEVEPIMLKHVSGTFRQTIKKKNTSADRPDDFVCVADAKVSWASVNSGGRPEKIPDKFLVPGLYPDETRK